MGAARPSLSVVVPVYNSADTLEELRVRLASSLAGRDYELVLVNDGSGDSSWQAIADMVSSHPRVRGIDLARNYGQHNALLAGIRSARGQTIITIDDDLQNPPEEIPKLLAKLDEGYDVVYGAAAGTQHGFARALGTRLTKWALRVAIGSRAAADASAFRAFRTHLRDAFADFHAPYVSIDALLGWGTTRFASVPVRHDARGAGESGYGFVRLASHAFNVLTGFTTRPLRLATLIGIAFTFVGLAVLVYVLVRFIISGNPVPGFPFLASMIAIFSGAQLLTLGIIGEYLARMHVRVMDRPAYSVSEEVGGTRATTVSDGAGGTASASRSPRPKAVSPPSD
jgi:glycosyltransferase involved in cell wall biosynthesis